MVRLTPASIPTPLRVALTGSWGRCHRDRVRLPLRLLGRRLPRTRGRMRVPGLAGKVVVRRDSWGIPHVDASSDADAWFGLGFCHG